jgi:hypothetical protein
MNLRSAVFCLLILETSHCFLHLPSFSIVKATLASNRVSSVAVFTAKNASEVAHEEVESYRDAMSITRTGHVKTKVSDDRQRLCQSICFLRRS